MGELLADELVTIRQPADKCAQCRETCIIAGDAHLSKSRLLNPGEMAVLNEAIEVAKWSRSSMKGVPLFDRMAVSLLVDLGKMIEQRDLKHVVGCSGSP